MSQLSRAVESRQDKRPILSDLRESGSLEQDSDLVAFVYRDEYYLGEESDQQGVAEINLAKHRNGPTGTVKLSFLRRYAKFADLARRSPVRLFVRTSAGRRGAAGSPRGRLASVAPVLAAC